MFRNRLFFAVVGVVAASWLLRAPVRADEKRPVFQKTLPSGQSLVEVREDVPWIPFTARELADRKAKFDELVKRDPGLLYVPPGPPDRNQSHALYLVSSDGKSRTMVWQRVAAEYLNGPVRNPNRPRPGYEILDAALEGDQVVVVQREVGGVVAEIEPRGATFTTRGMDEKWDLPDLDRIFSRSAETPIATGAEISGSLAENNLTVVVQTFGGPQKYRWTGKAWVKELPAPGARQPERNHTSREHDE